MTNDPPRRLVVRSGGIDLDVREHSPPGPDRETVVLVHGYPDQQDVWGPVLAALPADRLHLVTYDVRGAGGSGVPTRTVDYRTELLVEDLAAVLAAVLPEAAKAHLVGHDWGSVQLWDAVAAERDDPRLRGRIASFTSISGPSLTHLGWLVRHPGGRRRALLRQLTRSSYVYFFQLPVVPDLLWRHGHRVLARAIARRERLGDGHWGDELARNAVNGLNLYRANGRGAGRPPRRRFPTDVPVLVVRPTHDAYLTELTVQDLDRVCNDVRVARIDAGHWVLRTHPDELAALVVEHVERTR